MNTKPSEPIFDPDKNRICLAMSSLDMKKSTTDCLMSIADSRILSGWSIIGATLLPASRNRSVEMIYDNCPDFTHIVFIDDDMDNFGFNHVLKLVEDDKDVISALVTFRRPPYKLVGTFNDCNDQEVLDLIKDKAIIESHWVGMAFTVVKRHVLDAMMEHTSDGPVWFTMDREARCNFEEDTEDFIEKCLDSEASEASHLRDAIEFGRLAHVGTKVIGEDIAFSQRARGMGFKLWVDCGVSVGHIGEQVFDFRYSFMYSYQVTQEKKNEKITKPLIMP